VDCCYRIKQTGLSVVCDGHTDLLHVGHKTTGSVVPSAHDVLFEKAILLRWRWSRVFREEQDLHEKLTGLV
jgi:hypothetical protein